MIAESCSRTTAPADGRARRFNELMAARYDSIVSFLKLHYCPQPARGAVLARQCRTLVDPGAAQGPARSSGAIARRAGSTSCSTTRSFAFFNYQYILYGMEFRTDLTPVRDEFPHTGEAERIFERIRQFGDRAARDLPRAPCADRADRGGLGGLGKMPSPRRGSGAGRSARAGSHFALDRAELAALARALRP